MQPHAYTTPCMQRMGAAEVIDYREQDFTQVLQSSPVDAAVETVGGAPPTSTLRGLAAKPCFSEQKTNRRSLMPGCCAGDYSARTAAVTKRSGYVAHVFSQVR